ncbi:hrq family [Pyrenophora seminiperda CCB06]|uniref:Hrq family n=1 Tax=Pyrenophora seminiperda CCB06 TaxID=1302712 RepID=A0A3M7LXU3_9PLEO|nr:hrq family [Pyrenophora seminiperda CCB06]
MAFSLLLLLGATFIVSSLLILLRRSRRGILLERLRVSGRRVSGAKTPPRSLSPGNKSLPTTEVDYSDTFPPSRRFAVTEILKGEGSERSEPQWTNNILPMEASYLDADESRFLPCGLSVKEIKALGDFPDYATLSGVPLPSPSLPGSELACKELMEMVLQFLCARYPQYFWLSNNKRFFRNSILHTDTDLTTTPPLHVLLNNVPEDYAIMLRNEKTGLYVFRAGIICSALGWNVGSKIGLNLSGIHGPIPDYKEKMQFSMDRYFAKKPTDKPIQRGSWGLEVDQPLYMPPGDPHEAHRSRQDSALELARCHLRVDWQTLRRLPLSGAVVFNFKALFTPVEEFRDEAYVPGLMLKVLDEGKKNLMEYKNTWHVEHIVKPALAQWHKEQMESGVVEKDWEPRTLEESPWFPGWEEKWHRQQGF